MAYLQDPYNQVVARAGELGHSSDEAEDKIEELRKRSEVYAVTEGRLRAVVGTTQRAPFPVLSTNSATHLRL